MQVVLECCQLSYDYLRPTCDFDITLSFLNESIIDLYRSPSHLLTENRTPPPVELLISVPLPPRIRSTSDRDVPILICSYLSIEMSYSPFLTGVDDGVYGVAVGGGVVSFFLPNSANLLGQEHPITTSSKIENTNPNAFFISFSRAITAQSSTFLWRRQILPSRGHGKSSPIHCRTKTGSLCMCRRSPLYYRHPRWTSLNFP